MELCYLLMSGSAATLVIALAMSAAADTGEDPYVEARRRMVEEISTDVEMTSRQIGCGSLSSTVMEAMALVPRHEFVPEELRRRAYQNRPLPIGFGQTISQPYIVALMTDLLGLESGQKVLEVGTGSGYQAAILASLDLRVFSIEIIPDLAHAAESRLRRLGYKVSTMNRDGYHGWLAEAPFDAVIVTAAASHIPPPLVEQLKPGGVMVIPVGGPFSVQQLTVVVKAENGQVHTRQVLPVVFVPLTGER